MKKRFIITFIVCCYCLTVSAQQSLKATVGAVNDMRKRLPVEKLYLQLDKPYYSLGDTLRFKAYLLDADFFMPSPRSGLLYVELNDVAGRIVKRMMVPLATGVSWGNIALDEIEIPEGSYTLRAYTNWMRNFGEDYIFKQNIYVSALSGKTLVKASFKLDSIAGKNKVQAALRFTDLTKDALRLKDMQLRVKSGRKTLFRDKAATGMDGSLDINFDLADKTAIKDLSIQVQNITKGADTSVLTIPVTITRIENTDVQFMPEGGNLVAGIPAKIGFKAISEDGKGVEVKGKIYNSKQQEVAVFSSAHTGMGHFELIPQTGEIYTAKVTLSPTVVKNYPLPAVNPAGTALSINNSIKDSLIITLTTTPALPGPASAAANYYFIGQARGTVCYASAVHFKQTTVKITLAKELFPTGIARFTLLNGANQPLNERVVFIDHNDNLKLNLAPSQPVYNPRDSIALNLQVTDQSGAPVQGTFSVAVTDDSQVRTDTLGSNMINNLLFTSDLKGTIEQPGWYFENNTTERLTALDDLLLTQGWVGYDWKQINSPETEPQYLAQKEFIVEGRVTNIFNKGVEKSGVLLFSQKPELVRDTITDKDGRFIFKGLFPVDTAQFKLQARNKNGKSFNVDIAMLNEFKPPVFAPNGAITPWYINSDTVLLNNSNTKQAQLKAEANYRGEGTRLNEVVIKAKKTVKESHNVNGAGEADLVLDEQDLLKAAKTTLGQLLKSKIKGFMEIGTWTICPPGSQCHTFQDSYLISNQLIFFFFDGILLLAPPIDGTVRARYHFVKPYMDYYSAEEIKGIEVMYNTRYTSGYGRLINNLSPLQFPHAIIEITTRGGKGPWMKVTPGAYLYKPLPFTLPKDFYRPRYTVKNSNIAPGTDLRSTIHWEPNLVTDTTGKATLSFFSADKPADYTVIIEGTDLNGNIGYRRQKIKVTAKTTTAAK